MLQPDDSNFTRYLSSKKSVDDRALNHRVWQTLAGQVSPASAAKPLRILEIGAGIGTMLERMLEWELLTCADYTGIDAQAENIGHANRRLPGWAAQHGFQLESSPAGEWRLARQDRQVSVRFASRDLFDFAGQEQHRCRWDLLVAHAFLDLMDIPATLPVLFNLLREDGLYYFSLNFDGLTLLEPAIDPLLDELIQSLYHQTMDARLTDGRPSGDSRSGRHLFTYLRQAGARILDAGASDWVVFPIQGSYPQDETYFLHFIVHTIHRALAGHPQLDPVQFVNWVKTRHAQIERRELVFIAHQLDFVGRI